ncbi:MAG: AraC family transcriptional regulator [Clostridiales bacterium]|nr:AraC family transcriptional regulator [Clostridiales bacterium]
MNKDYSLEENVTHGTKLQPIRCIRFSTGKGTVYPERFFVQRHWHHSCEILRILKGKFTIEIDLERYELREGDICIIGSGELHQLEGKGSDTLHDVIIFNPHILEFSYEDQFQEDVIAPILSQKYALPHLLRPGEAAYDRVMKEYDKIIKHSENQYFESKLGLLIIMNELKKNNCFIKTSRIQNEAEKLRVDRYKTLISYMEEHFMEKVTLDDLGRLAGCNTQYLCHFFKEISGVSPMQYLIEYRISQAQNMLMHTTKSILEISLDCGFDNVSYFIRQFRKYKGMTPGKYRRTNLYT